MSPALAWAGASVGDEGLWGVELRTSGSGVEAGMEGGDPRPCPGKVEVVAGWGPQPKAGSGALRGLRHGGG